MQIERTYKTTAHSSIIQQQPRKIKKRGKKEEEKTNIELSGIIIDPLTTFIGLLNIIKSLGECLVHSILDALPPQRVTHAGEPGIYRE